MIDKEKIVCAAIWYKNGNFRQTSPKNIDEGIVVFGLRHNHCFELLSALYPNKEYISRCEQGFLTTDNRFVDREEASKIAIESGQIEKCKYTDNYLYSEDLY